jgi:hypothetical protein
VVRKSREAALFAASRRFPGRGEDREGSRAQDAVHIRKSRAATATAAVALVQQGGDDDHWHEDRFESVGRPTNRFLHCGDVDRYRISELVGVPACHEDSDRDRLLPRSFEHDPVTPPQPLEGKGESS